MPDDGDIEAKVRQALDRLGVRYEIVTCDPQYADTTEFCARYGYPSANAGNTIITVTKKEPRRYAACIVLATTKLDVNRTVKRLLGGGKVSFASAEDTRRVTGMEVGGVTPFQLPGDLPIYVDAGIMALDFLILGSGARTSKIRIAPEIFRRLPNSSIVEGLALPRPD